MTRGEWEGLGGVSERVGLDGVTRGEWEGLGGRVGLERGRKVGVPTCKGCG